MVVRIPVMADDTVVLIVFHETDTAVWIALTAELVAVLIFVQAV